MFSIKDDWEIKKKNKIKRFHDECPCAFIDQPIKVILPIPITDFFSHYVQPVIWKLKSFITWRGNKRAKLVLFWYEREDRPLIDTICCSGEIKCGGNE